ncbi:MAG: BACON domain-containing protein, partial [Acidobacteria bacterium]|nr:BACON domain-containing protein [Acidobacteriota bacterium]
FTGFSGDLSGSANPQQVTMSGPKTVTANFTALTAVTIATNPAGLQITVDGTAYTAPQVMQWLPGSQHSISTASPQDSAGTRRLFASWSDGGAQLHTVTTPGAATTYTALFSTQYLLTTAASPGAGGSVSPASGYVNAGELIQVSASANAGYQFTGFSGDLSGSANPQQLKMDGPRTVTANFSALVGATITTNPAGLEITVDGAAYTAPQVFQWVPGSQHTISTASPQDAGGTRRNFANWSDGGAQSHTVTAPATAATYTASFSTQYLLTTAASPAAGGTVSPASGYVNAGTQVQVSAAASAGYQFTGFSGDLNGSVNPQPVAMDGPRTVTANFSALIPITVATNPAGLQVTVDGTAYPAPQVFQWVAGSQHTVAAAAPQDSSGTRRLFGSWSDGGEQTHTLTVPASATSYTAAFTTQYLFSATAIPAAGGSVSPASGYVNAGTQLQVSAAANAGYQFSGFSGDLGGSGTPQSLTMDSPKSVTANFTALTGVTVTTNPAGLQVSVDGTVYTAPQVFQWAPGGQHTVAAVSPQDAPGIRRLFSNWSDGGAEGHTITAPASATVYTAVFSTQYLLTAAANPAAGGAVSPLSGYVNAGAPVQVSALANPGYQFSGFSGDLAGAANPQTLTMSGPRSVTANFTALPTTFAISGSVGLSGVTVALSGSAAASTTSDAAGAYSFAVLPAGGQYTVTPSKAGFTYNPASQSVASLTANTVLNWSAPTPVPVTARLSLSALNFGSNLPLAATTPSQEVMVSMNGGSPAWTATPDQGWLKVAPGSGAGSGSFRVSADPSAVSGAGKYTGKVRFSAASAGINIEVLCTLTVLQATTAPIGSFDTPADNANLASSFAVTGWALDDVGVANVKIWRDPVAPEPAGAPVFVGDALFVPGTRPDVEAAFPGMPQVHRAGWGYMLLSNFLPNGGNGTYKLYAIATDLEGRKTTLGAKTIRVDNAHATKPFGAIDTPGQGETAGGAAYVNFGWALTPQPGKIPVDGSTIQVYLDGVPAGTVNYNHPRADVDSLFPGYANTGGAVGFKYLDTTQLANGIHTIAWSVTDNLGRSDGIGSRFFWVLNGSAPAGLKPAAPELTQRRPGKPSFRTGYSAGAALQELREIEVEELERIEVVLPAPPAGTAWSGVARFGAESRPLPAGSSFDAEAGIFRWQLGPGFLGRHELEFTAGGVTVPVAIRITTPRRPAPEGNEGSVR